MQEERHRRTRHQHGRSRSVRRPGRERGSHSAEDHLERVRHGARVGHSDQGHSAGHRRESEGKHEHRHDHGAHREKVHREAAHHHKGGHHEHHEGGHRDGGRRHSEGAHREGSHREGSHREHHSSRDEKPRERERERFTRAKRLLAQAVKEHSRVAALEAVLDMLEHKEEPPQESLRGMLENAACKPGPDLFTKTLQCCALGGLRLEPQDYAKLLGMLLSRESSHAQLRAVLNLALPKGARPIPLTPADLSAEETRVAFQDAAVVQDEEDEDVEDGDSNLFPYGPTLPKILEFKNCVAVPFLNGEYHALPPMPGILNNDRPVYVKEFEGTSQDPAEGPEVYAYYWEDEPHKPWLSGWWLGFEVGGDEILAYNASSDWMPPRQRWQMLVEGQRCADPGTFGLPGEGPMAKGPGRDPDETEQALSKLDLQSLQGILKGKSPDATAYFGHFVTLLHLEHLAEINVYRRRMLRHTTERLSRMGWALPGLQCFAIYGHRDSRKGLLPGWSDKGAEFVAFSTPPGVDLERMRIKKGDSVIVSRGDPLEQRVAEGTIVDFTYKKIVVNLNGVMPEGARQSLWRLDAYANRTVYERQMAALLQLVTAEKPEPLLEMLLASKVGQLDTWAKSAVTPPWRQKEILSRPVLPSKQSIGGGNRGPSGRWQPAQFEALQSAKGSTEAATESRSAALARELPRGVDKAKLAAAAEEVEGITGLNVSQREAVEKALGRTCTIIHGPPGTGKTHVSVKVLQLWARAMGLKPLLATSDSNVAVDNIAEGLHRLGVKAVRVGRPEKVRGRLEEITLEAMFEREKADKDLDELRGDDEQEPDEAEEVPAVAAAPPEPLSMEQEVVREHNKGKTRRREDFEARMKILRDMEVICATTISAGSDFLSRFHFHGVLLDEVAQATELSSIVPIVVRGAKQVALVGDHCQLPPSVMSREAELRGLSLSVYSRLVDVGVDTHFLDTQYRSHPRIAEFSAKCFYGGRLRSGVPGSQRPPPKGVTWPNPLVPVAFFQVGDEEVLDGESKSNPAEAELVCNLVLDVLGLGELELSDIGVVTPYMAQVRLLRRTLRDVLSKEENVRLLEIASVDNFQGREKELIIFSAVRSNAGGNVGFLADWRRLNVMLTRARRGLVVFGSAGTLRHDAHWQQWLEWCHKHNATHFPSAPQPKAELEAKQQQTWRVPKAMAKVPPMLQQQHKAKGPPKAGAAKAKGKVPPMLQQQPKAKGPPKPGNVEWKPEAEEREPVKWQSEAKEHEPADLPTQSLPPPAWQGAWVKREPKAEKCEAVKKEPEAEKHEAVKKEPQAEEREAATAPVPGSASSGWLAGSACVKKEPEAEERQAVKKEPEVEERKAVATPPWAAGWRIPAKAPTGPPLKATAARQPKAVAKQTAPDAASAREQKQKLRPLLKVQTLQPAPEPRLKARPPLKVQSLLKLKRVASLRTAGAVNADNLVPAAPWRAAATPPSALIKRLRAAGVRPWPLQH